MTKTNITNIKTTIMDTLLNDMRIIRLFGSIDAKSTFEYMNNNIFPYLHIGNNCYNCDTYIHFDVTEGEESNVLIFEIRTHKDIIDCVPSNLDKASEYIFEDVLNKYPMCKDYIIGVGICNGHFVEKNMHFILPKNKNLATPEKNDGCELINALRKYYENNSHSYKKDISDAIVNILKKYNVSANDIGDILITLPKKLTLNVVRDKSSEE